MFSNKSDVYLFSFQCSVSARLPDCLSIIPNIPTLVKHFFELFSIFYLIMSIFIDIANVFYFYYFLSSFIYVSCKLSIPNLNNRVDKK